MKISIIVPAYNVEKYILDTLESLLTQSFSDYEVVVVDDGSSDKTGQLCDDLKKQYSNLIVLHQDNGGVSSARMNGFIKSKGEWVIFVDGDDKLTSDALEFLYSYTNGKEVDIVRGIRCNVDALGHIVSTEPKYFEGLIDGYLWQNLICKHPKALHGLLYRRELLERYILVDRCIVNNEDQLFNLFLSPRVRKVYCTGKIVLHYSIRNDSVSKKKYDEEYWYMFLNYVEKKYREYNVSDKSYRYYILTRLTGLMRCTENYCFDYNKGCFANIKLIPYSLKYGLSRNFCLFTIRHPKPFFLALLRLHPKLLVSNVKYLFARII